MDNQHKKIKGYRDLTQEEIDLMNEIKDIASNISEVIDKLYANEDNDIRWISIGEIDLQKGIMSIVRSVAKPESF